jgi:hypothetical protein
LYEHKTWEAGEDSYHKVEATGVLAVFAILDRKETAAPWALVRVGLEVRTSCYRHGRSRGGMVVGSTKLIRD